MKKLICSLMVGTMIFGTVSSVASAVSHKKPDKSTVAKILKKTRKKNHEENLRQAIEDNWDELFPNILRTPVISESSSGSGSPDSSIMEDAIAMLSPIRPRVRRSSIMGDVDSTVEGSTMDCSSFYEGSSSFMRE